MSDSRVVRILTVWITLASTGVMVNAEPQRSIGIDHILIGVPDLDRTVDDLSEALGVRPVYGGKHPRGTHNALLSLGTDTYLEFIALQPGVAGADIGMGELVGLTRPLPIGWAVAAPSAPPLRGALAHGDFALSEPEAGSRTTPSGEILRWQTVGLTAEPEGAPFFIVWSPETRHPSSTSPKGCRLVGLQITTPDAKQLRALCTALTLPVEVLDGPRVRFAVALDCPNGPVTFRTDS
jgi:catechol 2,3-dioxygenase-like lactoylglutathione lyase family enzyme